MRIGRWQMVWWGFREQQGFGSWTYPEGGIDLGGRNVSIFKGWRFGIFEIRHFMKQWERPTTRSDESKT